MLALALVLAAAPSAGCFSAKACTAACDKSDAHACYTLAMMKIGGVEAPDDKRGAVPLLEKACFAGSWPACQEAVLYVNEDEALLAKVTKRAAELKPRACAKQTLRACDNYAKAVPALQKECAAKNGLACAEVARSLAEGTDKDGPKKSHAWLEKACNAGVLSSCDALGDALIRGNEGEQDVARGEKLVLKACDGGSAAACMRLGNAQLGGDGPPFHTFDRSNQLRKQACDLGYAQGCGR